MTGERISAIFHFFDNGIYIECEDLDIGKFVSKGDGNAIMEVLNEIEDYSDPNTTFTLTKKGKKIAEEITSSFSDDFCTTESISRFEPVIQLPKGSIKKNYR